MSTLQTPSNNGPAPTAGFAHKQMAVEFSFGALVGAKMDWSQPRTVDRKVEDGNALRAKESKRNFGTLGVVRLHHDPARADTSPVCFQEMKKRGIVASLARRGGDGEF